MGKARRVERSERRRRAGSSQSRASAETARGVSTARSIRTARRRFHRQSGQNYAAQGCSVAASIEFEFLHPGLILRRLRLIIFRQQKIAQYKIIHRGAHETAVGVGGRADNRFAAHVERSIDEDTRAGAGLKMFEQSMKSRVGGGVNRLDARRIVHV